MGHARTYLGFDIIKRIMEDYFGYEVDLVMNITDLDDKIIARANELNISHYELSNKFEMEFHEDMAALGVAPPNVLTRVTDYMDEIVTYINEMVVDKGVAYESNGSVYFDVAAFTAKTGVPGCGGTYGKLEPECIGDLSKLAEGEGNLFTQATHGASDKRSPKDFALWKATKDLEKEPSWDSPWGKGRPGWHIECSVMATSIFEQMGVEQGCMDIHSGGVDLKFPHHDNEIAQSESHNGCSQWVNYFVHSGHLHIKGFKMSKSLKNFISIRQALEQNNARQIRLCFLMHKYNAPMDYGDNTMQHAIVVEKTFVEFFHNVKAALRNANAATLPAAGHQKWGEREKGLSQALTDGKACVEAALKDDFDTPAAMTALLDLMKACNLYMEACERDQHSVVSLLLKNCALYVTKILNVFGVTSTPPPAIGFINAADGADASQEETLTPILDALMQFRSSVRAAGRSGAIGEVLKECDAFRDDVLPELGVRLEDKSNDASVWKLADPSELRREKELKEQEMARKAAEKAEMAKQAALKEKLNKMPPTEFMKQLTLDDNVTLKYDIDSFDAETGLPTKMSTGELLNKNQSKKAMKEYQGQKKKFDKFNAKANAQS